MNEKKILLPAGLTQKSLAQSLSITEIYLSYLLNRHQRPSVRLAKRIEAATNGAIRWTEFFPDESSA